MRECDSSDAGAPETGRVGVEFVIEESDIPGLDYAGPRVVGPSNYLLINAPVNQEWEPIPGGKPTLEIYVEAIDRDEAQAKAETLYAELRKEGGLPPQPEPRVTGLFPAAGKDPLWLQHFDEAQDMVEQQRYELSVVAAQIACEIEIRAAIEAVADAPEGSLARMAIDAPRSYSLIDQRAQEIFRRLLGETPKSQEFWPGYRDHVERRNNVLHRGARITRGDAVASVQVASSRVRPPSATAKPQFVASPQPESERSKVLVYSASRCCGVLREAR